MLIPNVAFFEMHSDAKNLSKMCRLFIIRHLSHSKNPFSFQLFQF